MTALPADIARYTTDGVVVRSPVLAADSDAIKAAHVDARDLGDREIEMFYDNPAHAQIILNERFSYASLVDPVHLGIEIEDSIGIGETVPITPNVPCFTAQDGDVSTIVRTRAYAQDMGSDRYSVEVLQ